MSDKLTHRFKEGWVLLRRPFDFAELDYKIPKLSLVYVYSERPEYEMRLTQKYWDRIKQEDDRLARIPEFLKTEGIKDILDPQPDEQREVYKGETVQTLFNGHLTKFFSQEYTPTNISKYQADPQFHHHFKLRKNDEMYLKQTAIVDKIHYLMSRGMDRQMSELYASPAAKHSVWYEPTDGIKEYFSGLNPLQKDSNFK